jgi:RNA polymerase sigma-70 factor (ECF subfamily)
MPDDRHFLPGPHGRSFPTTRWSLVLAAVENRGPESRHALDVLCRLYWPPVYSYVRSAGHDAQAALDLTQGFFARLLEKGDLKQADRARGRFRSFLLASVKHFASNEWDRARAQRRGGGKGHFSLDIVDAEAKYGLSLVDPETPETIFEKRWALTLLEHALARLEKEMASSKHARHFQRFKPFLTVEGGDESYRDLARELGLSEPSIKVAIHRMRRRFGALLREEVAQTLNGPSAADVDDELRYLFSVIGS